MERTEGGKKKTSNGSPDGRSGKERGWSQNPLYLSMSVSREESRKPLANGLLSIFNLVI